MKKSKVLLLSCSCGCKAQLQIQKVDDNLFLIDTREDGRKRWTGVALKEKDVKKLRDFLSVKT